MFGFTYLTSWEEDLPKLKVGTSMFWACTRLRDWDVSLPSLADGRYMFQKCTKLRTFKSDLSNLVNGFSMFSDTGLETFRGDLSSLVDGEYMFSGCNLNVESVDSIARSIARHEEGYHTINIGIGCSEEEYKTKRWLEPLRAIQDKGWKVVVEVNE